MTTKRRTDNLRAARVAKDDEFYTRMEDIQLELKHYKTSLIGKIIYCNCDHPDKSNFYKYFKQYFNELCIKKVICTFYGEKPFKTEFDGITETRTPLSGDGSFDSEECIKILNESDICITNPPFSLVIRRFIPLLLNSKKDWLFIGSNMIFDSLRWEHLFFNGKNNTGVTTPGNFTRPDGSLKGASCVWYTTLPVPERPFMNLTARYYGNEGIYEKYNGVDVIFVRKTSEIPCDYTGMMALPTTFITTYNRNQFDIICTTQSFPKTLSKVRQQYIGKKLPFLRVVVINKHPQPRIS